MKVSGVVDTVCTIVVDTVVVVGLGCVLVVLDESSCVLVVVMTFVVDDCMIVVLLVVVSIVALQLLTNALNAKFTWHSQYELLEQNKPIASSHSVELSQNSENPFF